MFLIRCESRCDEPMAFPSRLRSAARETVASAAIGELHVPRDAFVVNVDAETLHIPYRVYYDPDLLRRKLSNSQATAGLMLLSLGTRHYDGYLRHECLRELLNIESPWLIPYVVQLAGEYVVEIAEDVVTAIGGCGPAKLRSFVLANPAYLKTLERRVTSYWSCYYRQAYPDRHAYPGTKVLAMLRATVE